MHGPLVARAVLHTCWPAVQAPFRLFSPQLLYYVQVVKHSLLLHKRAHCCWTAWTLHLNKEAVEVAVQHHERILFHRTGLVEACLLEHGMHVLRHSQRLQ